MFSVISWQKSQQFPFPNRCPCSRCPCSENCSCSRCQQHPSKRSRNHARNNLGQRLNDWQLLQFVYLVWRSKWRPQENVEAVSIPDNPFVGVQVRQTASPATHPQCPPGDFADNFYLNWKNILADFQEIDLLQFCIGLTIDILLLN